MVHIFESSMLICQRNIFVGKNAYVKYPIMQIEILLQAGVIVSSLNKKNQLKIISLIGRNYMTSFIKIKYIFF